MRFTGKRLIKKIVAVLIIMMMTLADFSLIGVNVVSYALDMVATNSNNVEFSAYFINEQKEKVTEIDSSINAENLKMYVEISVKNEGYFNGEITLGDSSFNFSENISNEYVKEVKGNTVTLNQINAGTTASIELKIDFANSNEIKTSSLSQVSEINLTGTYVNSKKNVDIKGKTSVKVNWKSPEDVEAKLNTKILTNSIYKVNDVNKRIVQVLVNSKLNNNSYPVKETNIELNVPDGVEEVKVHARSTYATNGNENNFEYNADSGELTISLKNEENDGKIKWNKDAQDSLVVTYLYPENTVFNYEKINSNVTIATYDHKEVKAESQAIVSENIDGIVTNEILEREEEIYKGKIYTGEERDYTTTTVVNVDYFDAIDEIEISEREPVFIMNDEDKKANIEYKQSKIKKSDFEKILGEDGNITIVDQDKTTIVNINKDTETDENGYFVVDYSTGVKSITIEISKPVSNGILNIEHTKTIKDSKLSREEIKKITAIKEEVECNSNIETKLIELKETESKIIVDVNKETLTTKNKNEALKITTTLLTKDEDKELYKNPTIKIVLPKDIEKVENAKCGLLYGEGLNVKNSKLIEDNGKKIVEIELEGNQNKYSKEAIEGTKVLLQADVILKSTAINAKEKIAVNVTNENTEKTVNGEKEIEIINFNSIITTNDIEEYGIETANNDGIEKISLDINQAEKEATVQSRVINNENTKINNVRVLGELPSNNSKNNVGIEITKSIKVKSNNDDKVSVYYTEEENATDEIENANNKWKKDLTAKVKKYLIVVDEIDVGEEINYSYSMKVPGNLSYNMTATENYEVKYENAAGTEKSVKSTEITLTTGVEAEISQTVKASVAGNNLEDGAEIKTGEIVKYEITLENKGNKDAEGIKVKGTVPEGTKKVELKDIYDEDSIRPGADEKDKFVKKQYIESDEQNVTFDKINIKAGKKVVLTYEVRVKEEIEDGKDVNCNIVSIYNEKDSSSMIKHKLRKADISMDLSTEYRNSSTIKSGYNYEYCLDIKNNSTQDKENIKIKIENNEVLKVSNLYYIYDNQRYILNNENDTNEYNIEKIKAGDTISVWITTMVQSTSSNLEQAEIRVISTENNNTYYSNIIKEDAEIVKVDVEVKTKSNSNSKDNYVVSGNNINYTITLKNSGKVDAESLLIKDEISNYLTVKSVKIDGKDVNYSKETQYDDKKSYSVIGISVSLKAGKTSTVEINTSVNNIVSSEVLEINNKIDVYNNTKLFTAEGDTYYIKNAQTIVSETEAEKNADGYAGNNNTNSDEDNSNNEKNESKYIIKGIIWYDEDKNGLRITNENNLSEVNVYLLNSTTNEIVANTKSGEDGAYTFTDIAKGEYIVIFEYDTNLYIPTIYQAKGVSEKQNSDAIQSNININNENKTVAVTDNIKLNKNISNIDLGLIKAEKFDLELNKYVTKMTVVNSHETKVYEFDKSTLAKTEIAAKYLKDSTVMIEYTIEVKNTGELSGYVQSIVDYAPTELNFSSDLNKDWYKSGNYLYNDSLKNIEIKAGETKEIKLILSKKMTESNTGLTNNTAEIAKAYNNNGVVDIDSTPGNNQKEDDLGSADTIISVKTGAVVSYIVLTLSIVIVLAGVAYIINKKILNKNIKI